MVFSTILFLLVFLPIFLIIYELTPAKGKNYVLLAASIIFYAWGAPVFVFVILASLLANFFVVKKMHESSKQGKLYLIASVLINLGLLAYFKYANFFIDNVNALLSAMGSGEIHWTKIALPIGISFFTFQSLTYTLDVYRGQHEPLKKASDYLLYILMFPQLIAGPIVRFSSIANDIVDRKQKDTPQEKLHGIHRFAIGLGKKVLLANAMGAQVDAIYAMPQAEITTSLAWIAIIAYSFQIYFDFSGYSDMAIGLGRILGFSFPENFNNPYISQSITEFWRRWHITLGAWMKDYLYIPLGGNRVPAVRMYFNLWLVFLLSGLWHGASWNFVIWGAWHGLFLVLDRLFLHKVLKRIGKLPSILITYIIVLIGWTFFRIEEFNSATFYIGKMFDFGNFKALDLSREFWLSFAAAGLFAFLCATALGKKAEQYIFYKAYAAAEHRILFVLSFLLLLISVSYLSASNFNPFIYFRF